VSAVALAKAEPAGAMSEEGVSVKWIRKSSLEPLPVSMSGLKLGDRLLVIGGSDPLLIAALASKVGLTGRACAVDESEHRAAEAGRIAEREGALIETAHAPGWVLPFDESSFDVVVLRGVPSTDPQRSNVAMAESRRVLRPGGRAVVIEGTARRRLGALLSGGQPDRPSAADATAALESAGFVAVRTLAERDGMVFAEGVRPNL
jgi:SAM-dependent methyltransferase